ncbi:MULTISPECIES: AfsR/SARP family transcriptional regulator [unclassified Saccharothrix]|uniref:AfsR/SARP family transcriptional regulator n=1 Tax=unclassified Saccharothrix TaxID=2593673 RepID=UPI00307EAFD5
MTASFAREWDTTKGRWRDVGVMLEAGMRVHLRLLGLMTIRAGTVLVRGSEFPGRQGRLALAYLAIQRRPVTRDELAGVVWCGAPPDGWERNLAALVSKLRALLVRVGLTDPDVLATGQGGYELRLPRWVEVDVHAAAGHLEHAEVAMRAGRPDEALPAAETAANLARQPLLPGEEALWLDHARAVLRLTLVHALEISTDVLHARGDLHNALRRAEEAVLLEPFRESGHVRLMRVHLDAGNRAEGLRAYERCRRLLAGELGVDPSAETQAAYHLLLGG